MIHEQVKESVDEAFRSMRIYAERWHKFDVFNGTWTLHTLHQLDKLHEIMNKYFECPIAPVIYNTPQGFVVITSAFLDGQMYIRLVDLKGHFGNSQRDGKCDWDMEDYHQWGMCNEIFTNLIIPVHVDIEGSADLLSVYRLLDEVGKLNSWEISSKDSIKMCVLVQYSHLDIAKNFLSLPENKEIVKQWSADV